MRTEFPPEIYVFLVIVTLLFVGLLLATDNKRRRVPRPSRESRAWRAVTTTAVPRTNDPIQTAFSALSSIGASSVSAVDGVVIGFIGSWWTNVGRLSQYQLAIEYIEEPDAGAAFICACRPRFSSQPTGADRARELTRSLAAELHRSPSQD